MGLCARFVLGVGCVGVVGVLEFRFSTCSLALIRAAQGVWGLGGWRVFLICRLLVRCGVLDCWDVMGMGSVFCGGVFRFGKKYFGAAYYLCDECHILNIFGVTACSE